MNRASDAKPLIAIFLPDLRGGGAERLHVNLARAWLDRGYSVQFVLMQQEGHFLELIPYGATVHALGVRQAKAAIRPLKRYLEQERPDVLLAAMWPLTVAAAVAWNLAGRPGRLFLSEHVNLGYSNSVARFASPSLLSWSIRLLYPLASGVIAVSEGVRQDLLSGGKLDKSRVKVIYNPVAINVPDTSPEPGLRSRVWGSEEGYKLLSIGTLKEQKDHATLLRAFAQLPKDLNASLVILGEGPLRASIEALAHELGISDRVNLAGFHADLSDWLKTADLFVLSSRWEGFANVIVEALSFGVPVVSTDCPSGPSEILANGHYGRLVPVQDSRALAAAICCALEEDLDRQRLVSRSRDFDVDLIAEQYLATFDLRGHRTCA